jgi:cytochrome P450
VTDTAPHHLSEPAPPAAHPGYTVQQPVELDPDGPIAIIESRPDDMAGYAVYERVRAMGALVRDPIGVWVSVDHAVCAQILRDPAFGVRPAGDPGPTEGPETDLDLSFLERDPPAHARLRRLVAPAFRPRLMRRYAAQIDEYAIDLFDRIDTSKPFDLIGQFAAPLPIGVITTLMGIPDADVPRLVRHGAAIGTALSGVRTQAQADALAEANADLTELFTELVALRRQRPGEDVISHLVSALPDGITGYELMVTARLLLIAGFETTANLIGNGIAALLDHPEQWARLVADPELAADAVEEVLRFDPPAQGTSRVTQTAVSIAGQELPRDTWVQISIAGANRDPKVYPDPGRFDLGRSREVEHLAFSGGIHYCLGAPLARLEGTVAFGLLARRLPGLVRAGAGSRRASLVIRGYSHLPVRDGG